MHLSLFVPRPRGQPACLCTRPAPRYGLAIGYYSSWLVRGLMFLTCPITWPIGKLLDAILGADHRALFRWGRRGVGVGV